MAVALEERYGSAVHVFEDTVEPADAFDKGSGGWPTMMTAAGDPAVHAQRIGRGHDSYYQPLKAGLSVYNSDRTSHCASGYMFRAGEPTNTRFPQRYSGLVTAGHCLGTLFAERWRQGGHALGQAAQNNLKEGSRADAGTIMTSAPPVATREVSNGIFITTQSDQLVTRMQNENADATGDRVCMSGPVSGVRCGKLRVTSMTIRIRGKKIRSQRQASFPCARGDSGSPVYLGSTGIGIAVAFSHRTRNCFYTHVGHIQQQLSLYLTRH